MKKPASLVFPSLFLVFFGACEDPVSTTAATRQVPDLELSFTLQDGLNGYTGTTDTSTYKVPVGFNPHPGTFVQIYAQGQADATTGRNAFIRFDLEGVKTQIQEAMAKLGDDFSITDCSTQLIVNDAVASVFGFSDISSVSTTFSMTALKTTAAQFTEDDATTWTQANSTQAWDITAAGGGIDTFNDQYIGLNTYVDLPSSDFGQWFEFRLHRPHVQSWLCDQTKNKGVLLTVVGGGSSGFGFAAREFSVPGRRPMLQLKIQVYATAPSR